MSIPYTNLKRDALSTQIADAIRDAILKGHLIVDQRLPSETELAERFNVSRPTVREALRRLAAQNLIRTQRGPTGGAFVNRMSWSEAHDALVTINTLLIGMHDIPFEAVIEARFTLEISCLPLAAMRRSDNHLSLMHKETTRQRDMALSDEDFCSSDVGFHRSLADATGNPVLSFQMAGAIEAMLPLMNMLTYRMRDRTRIADLHDGLIEAMTLRDVASAEALMRDLWHDTLELTEKRRAPKD